MQLIRPDGRILGSIFWEYQSTNNRLALVGFDPVEQQKGTQPILSGNALKNPLKKLR